MYEIRGVRQKETLRGHWNSVGHPLRVMTNPSALPKPKHGIHGYHRVRHHAFGIFNTYGHGLQLNDRRDFNL